MHSKIFSKRSVVATTSLFFILLLFSSSGANAQIINFTDNPVDQDSNVDSKSNFGDDGSSNFSDATSFNNLNQTISEQNTGRAALAPDEDWSNFKDIFVSKSKISSDLTNFPLMVSVYDRELRNRAQSDGDDIAFFDEDGNQLPHELEIYNDNFNSTHAQMVVWIKTDLASSSDTIIRMKYGNSTMSSQQDPNNVWDNYAGVYHLSNDPSQGANSIVDSSSSNNAGTPSGGMNPADQVSGVIGDALDFDGNNDYIDLGNSASLQLTGAITVEAWFKGSTDIANDYIVSKSGTTGNRGWDLSFDGDISTDGWAMFRYTDSSQVGHSEGYESISIDTWYHLVGVYNPSTYERFYLNGVLVSENTDTIPISMFDSSVNALIGTRDGAVDYYEGLIDEVRISDAPRTSDWISVQYNNQLDPNNFYTITQEYYYDNPWSNFKYITLEGNKIFGDLTNFPVLISLYDEDLKGVAKSSGDDIAFFDDFGSQLYHEIEIYNENYNATHAQLVAWVKTDLNKGAEKRITMKYGAPSLTSQENPDLVWDSEYLSVWHLGESPTGALNEILDSTTNNNDGYTLGMDSNDLITSQIGNGFDLDGINDLFIANESTSLDGISDTGTISLWINWVDSSDGGYQRIMTSSNRFSANDGFELAVQPDGDYYFYPWGGNGNNYNLATNPFTNSQWHYLTVTLDFASKTVELYLDGSELIYAIENVGATNWVSLANIDDWIWGSQSSLGAFITAQYDEIRVIDNVRSAEWIGTEFNNQNDPYGFYTVSEPLSYDPEFWSYSKDLVIDKGRVDGDLKDFPLLIDITDSDLKTNAQNDGNDIAFFNEQGAQLSHEIELYNSSYSGTHARLVAWVKADLKGDVNTRIVMKYGNSTMTSQQNPSGVWDSNYAGVWHLNQNPASGATIYDSTANNNDGTAQNTLTSDDQISAKLGYGLELDYSDVNDYIVVPNSPSLDITGSQITLEAWVYMPTLPHPVDAAVIEKAPGTNLERYMLGVDGGTNPTKLNHRVTTGSGHYRYDTGTINQATWTRIVMVYDGLLGSDPRFFAYVDGILVSSSTAQGSILTTNADLNFGRRQNGAKFGGWIDELRISNIARSSEYLNTSFINQNDPGGFISVGLQVSKLVFEDTVDDHQSNLDGVADKGTHSNFYDERSKDGINDTLTEFQGNTFSLNSTSAGYVEIGGGNADWRSSQGTISFWIYYNSFSNDRPWGLDTNMEIRDDGTDSLRADWGGSSLSLGTTLVTDKWYFLALTWNDATDNLAFYLGNETTAPTASASTSSWTNSVTGVPLNYHTFLTSVGDINREIDGYGDELRYWNIERSQDDLQSDYNQILTGRESGLKSYLKFENDLIDSGPDGNDATIVGTAPFTTSEIPIFNYELDLEVQFHTIPHLVVDAELAILTGTFSSETLHVDYWNGSEWINLMSNLNSSKWNNVSLFDYTFYDTFTIRFRDSTAFSDITQDTWEIDVVLLDYTNYQLEWEHQSQSVDTNRENYYLSVYGFTTDPYETFEIQLWDQIASQWITLATSISTFEQWHNITITNPDIIGTTITWRYKGDKETRDNYQGILLINYAGIATYDEAPVPISTPSDIPNYIEGVTMPTLTWNFTDDNPNTYTIYRNDAPIAVDQPWTNADAISRNIRGLSKGSYNFTIEVIDDNSNPTKDQVNVDVFDLTAPIFDSTPSDILYNETDTGNSLIWNSTDTWPNNYVLYRNDVQVDANSWTSATNISYVVDGLARGDYNFTLVVFDEDSQSATDMVWVNVTDVMAPVFDTVPTDYQYNEGVGGNSIVWDLTDLHESTYTLYRNNVSIFTDVTWTNGSAINIDINGLTAGLYNFTITVFDDTGNIAIDTVWITVIDVSDPFFTTSPSTFPYSEGDTGTSLIWVASDASPNSYFVYRWDGSTNTTVENGIWSSGVNITIDIDGLGLGTYNFSIYIFDQDGNSQFDSVLITVLDTTAPLIIEAADINDYIEGTAGNSIIWDVSDLHPNNFTIYENGTFKYSQGWSSGNYEYNLIGLSLGVYNYTIVFTDDSNNQASDTVWVTVLDNKKPIIDNPDNVIYPVGSAGNEILWVGTDLHPDYYVVLRNGSQVEGPLSWVSQGTITVNIDGRAIGFYNYTILIFDSSGNFENSTVILEVTKESVFQSTPENNVFYIIGDTGNSLGWTVSDVNPHQYIIYNESNIIDSGNWTNEVQISINIDGLGIGVYNFSIFVNNTNSNFITHQLIVTVSDMPIFSETPSNITNYIEGDPGYSLTWNFTDLAPDTYTIFNNSIEVETNTWDNATDVILVIDGLAKGIYNFTIIIYDLTGNYNTSTVWVTVLDQTAPIYSSPENIPNYTEGSSNNYLNWTVIDLYPNNYTIYQNLTELVGSGSWNNGVNITLNIDGLSKGVYNFTLTIYDVSGNSNTTIVWVTVLDQTIPNINSPSDITLTEGDTGPIISWTPIDLYEDNYTIFRNEVAIAGHIAQTWANSSDITLDLDGYPKGLYNITVIVYDKSGNYNTSTFWVTVLDQTIPNINSPSDITFTEGDVGPIINWTTIDLYEDNYTIFRNEVAIAGHIAQTWTNGSDISLDLDGYAKGSYNITVIVYDVSGNYNASTVWVIVNDETIPNISSPNNITFTEGDVGPIINWTAIDLYQNNYTIFRDDVPIVGHIAQAWTNSSEINLDLDGYLKGLYNISIIVYDKSGNYNTSTVWVTVNDNTNPTINTPSNKEYDEGTIGYSINWLVTDLYEDNYTIYLDDVPIVGHITQSWTNSVNISLVIDGYAKGSYNISIIVYDKSGNYNTSTVWVTVNDGTKPVISDPPSDFQYKEGTTGNLINWTVSDSYPELYLIFNGSDVIDSGIWSSGNIWISVDGLPLGVYTFTLRINDTTGNIEEHQVIVTVFEDISPIVISVIPLNGAIVYSEGATGNSISWNSTDANAGTYTIYKDGDPLVSSNWTSGELITLDIDNLSKGFHNFSIIVRDSSLNTAGNWINVTVIDTTSPIIVTNSPDLTYESGSSDHFIYWNATDNYAGDYQIYLDGQPLSKFGSSGSWSSLSIVTLKVDEAFIESSYVPVLGEHNFTIIFYDADGNMRTHTILVTIEDTVAPVVTPDVSIQDSSVTFAELEENVPTISWDVTDKNSGNYTIYKNGIPSGTTQPWDSGVKITLILSTQGLFIDITDSTKSYNFTIVVQDGFGNTASHTIIVTLTDETNPIFLAPHPQNYNYTEGTPNHSISWSMDDEHKDRMEFYQNGSLVSTVNWNSSAPHSFNITGLPAGVYNFTLIVFDKADNFNSSSIYIIVIDRTDPSHNSGELPNEYVEGTLDNVLIWNAADLHADTWEVYQDGDFWKNGTWSSDTDIVVNIDGFPTGLYNFTIFVYDVTSNSYNHTISVMVFDRTAPVIVNFPDDFTYVQGDNDNFIIWNVTDAHPETYKILFNGDPIEQSSWASGVLIIFEFDQLPGFYNFTIIIEDESDQFVTDTVIVRVKDPAITDTQRPIITLETTVYEGDVEIVEGQWLDINGLALNEGTITVRLYFNGAELGTRAYQNSTNINGNYTLSFNYTGLEPGLYEWQIMFEKEDFLTWEDLIIEITILPHSYEIEIDVLPELIQGDSYTITAQIFYANNRTNINNNTGNLWFSTLTEQQGFAEGVEVIFNVTLIYENTDILIILTTVISNRNGIVSITLSPGVTRGLASIGSISAEIADSDFNNPTMQKFDQTKLPEILPAQPTIITIIIDFIRDNIIFLPIMTAGFLGVALVFLILNRRRIDRIREINNNIKSALVETNALNSIQSIIIQTSTKLTVFEEEVGTQSNLNINIVGGMVTAFSSFLNEIGKNEQFGFEMMEREGVSITAHKGRYSNFIVISNEKLPIVMLSKIPLVQAEIERQYQDNFTNTTRGVKKLTKNQVYSIYNKIGFKVVLRSTLNFQESNIRKLLKQRSLSRALKQNIRLLVGFQKSEFGKEPEFYLKDLLDYFKLKGITERISSRIIILGYQFKIIVPKGAD